VTAPAPSLADALRNRYTLERELGRGGMATVYLARDLRHDRPVALKVLRPELAASLGPERFLREIRLTARLQHPHILPVHDSGEAAGQLWYTMPYVEGESLRARLEREKQLPLEDALQISQQVLAALGYAHARGVIHRDIKPENILLQAGEAVVADFGIAHALDAAGGERLTGTGLALGTPLYMSPEQGAGEGGVGARSDIYSLGCVLYEMLAGEPPFTGPNAQAVIARRIAEPPRGIRVIRDAVPESVECAVQRALARVPADRFATAAEFAHALSLFPRTQGGAGSEAKWRRWIVPAAALMLVAAVGALLLRSRSTAPSRLDPDLIVVAPFDFVAQSLQPWSEGLVDVLSRSLDGAGPLRTVAPTVALRRWTGRADPASAAALGRRTGAGLVVFGSLDRTGSDSVRIRAALLAVGAQEAPLEVEVRGDTLRMDRLVDSLAVALLRELGRTRPVGAVRLSPLGAKSLPALKAFLRGGQFYRRGLWDSALAGYDRVIALDSTFALAYQRMGWVLGWFSASGATYKPGAEYNRRAAALNHGLAPRDSLLITVHTLQATVFDGVSSDAQAPHYFADKRRLVATLAEAQRRYAGDPEIWYALGETRWHMTDPGVATDEEALDAFDRSITLDSAFAPAYYHIPGLAIAAELGDPERARRYLAAYLRLNPQDDNTSGLHLTAILLDPEKAGLAETQRLIDAAPARSLFTAGLEYLNTWPDSAETAIRLLRSFAFGHHSFASFPSDSLERRRLLAFALTQRGHLREAHHLSPVFAATERWQNPYVRLALLGAVPVDTAAGVFRRSLERDLPEGVIGLVPVLPWWFAQRDTIALERFAFRVDSIARRHSTRPVDNPRRYYAADAARAFVTLLRGDSAGALRAFASLPDSVCGLVSCHSQKLTEARLLQAAGEERRAIELLERWVGVQSDLSPPDPLAVLERARLAERLGDRDKAVKSYQFVAKVWRNADPELQAYVMKARTGLERLTGEPRRKARSGEP
jgi:eukaryotic-like serine/threonine-protein kinase